MSVGVACAKQQPPGRWESRTASTSPLTSSVPTSVPTPGAENLLIYGWRIPFLLAFGTAMLGFVLRRGMPEPKAFLAAARAEKEAAARANGNAEAFSALEAFSATGSKM